ncbi:MAG: hypothetical protein D6765_02890 [Bacteroidetes bacterium]|nr:MAG: hypothetical protein D6765_02890 [Bacteroidota bacterium]
MKRFLLLMTAGLFGAPLQGQALPPLGLEFQVYPTGQISCIFLEKSLGEHYGLHLRVGYNRVRHRDLGVHEDERGGGFGFSVGAARWLKPGFEGWFFGVRNDWWFNELDWKDHIGTPEEVGGTTKVTVLQPTAWAGYQFRKGKLTFSPNLAFGVEVNVRTEGEPVGEGLILLAGLRVGLGG